MSRVIYVLAISLACATAALAAPQNRKAAKVLKLMKQVDGIGSGLDADTVRGLRPLVVVDANGAFVGAPLSLTDDSDGVGYVARRIGERPFRFHVSALGFSSGTPPRFYFAAANCTGRGT